MPRIIYGARKLRYEIQQRTGQPHSMQKAADGITAKMRELSGDPSAEMGRARLNNYELGKISETKTLELLGMSVYYSELLGRPIGTNDIVAVDLNSTRAFDQEAALQP